MNILAGLKLYGKKPKVDPAIRLANVAIPKCPYNTATTTKDRLDINDTPAASPSNPSIKFNVFVIPTIQKNVRGIPNHPK
jgi:hypothetical protein